MRAPRFSTWSLLLFVTVTASALLAAAGEEVPTTYGRVRLAAAASATPSNVSASICEPQRIALSCSDVDEDFAGGGDSAPAGVRPTCAACLLSVQTNVMSQHSYCKVTDAHSRTFRAVARVASSDNDAAELSELDLGTYSLTWDVNADICQPLPLQLPSADVRLRSLEVVCDDTASAAQADAAAVPCSPMKTIPRPQVVFTGADGGGRTRPLRMSIKSKHTKQHVAAASSQYSHAAVVPSASADPAAAATEVSVSAPVLAASHRGLAASYAPGVLPRRTMGFVAHPDDNIIFQSPQLLYDVRAGYPVRTVFITAGDNGNDRSYWHGEREVGAQASYAYMAGVANEWTESTQVIDGKALYFCTLNAASQIELVFLRLPDGNLNGRGTPSYGHQSLQQLWSSVNGGFETNRTLLTCIDGANTFTYDSLVSMLLAQMNDFQPTHISALDPVNKLDYDHSDHQASAQFTEAAHFGYTLPHVFDCYYGYTLLSFALNIVGSDLEEKKNTFFTYALYDSQVCQSEEACKGDAYLSWMQGEWVSQRSTNMGLVADAGSDRDVQAGRMVVLDGSQSYEQSGLNLTFKWTQTNGPTQALAITSSKSAIATFTAPNFATQLVFSLVVTTVTGVQVTKETTQFTTRNSSPDTVIIDVLAPIAAAGPDQTALTLASVTLDGSASYDPYGSTISFQWSQLSGPTVTLSSSTSASLTFTAPSASSVLVFALVVSNGQTTSAADSVTVIVGLPLPPVVVVGPDQAVEALVPVQLTAAGTLDPQGLPITYTWARVRGIAVTLSDTSAVSPTFTAPGNSSRLVFSVTVSNGQTDTVALVRVNVTRANAPLADAGGDQTVLTGAMVRLSAAASEDPANKPLVFAWSRLSGTPVQLSSLSAPVVTFDAPANATVLLFQLTVSNGQSASSTQVEVRVNEVVAPVATATLSARSLGASGSVAAYSMVTLDGSNSTDPQALELTYAWSQIPSSCPSVVLSNSSAAQPTFRAPSQACVLTFQLLVANRQKTSAPSVMTVTVRAPTMSGSLKANAGADQTVPPAATVKLTAAAAGSSSSSLFYQWAQIGNGTRVTLSSATASAPTFTAPSSAQRLQFQLVVSDGPTMSQPDTVTVLVEQRSAAMHMRLPSGLFALAVAAVAAMLAVRI